MATETTRFAPPQAVSPDLTAYYADRPQLWRNIWYLMSCRVGWDFVFNIIAPLMLLRLSEVGVGSGTIGLINAVNSWAVAVLVMYFSWRSDHTVSRLGRRLPYLLISAPFIIATVVLFPFFDSPVILITLMVVQLLAMDLKNSTFALLPIDITPRQELARFQSLYHIIAGLVTFVALYWGFRSWGGAAWIPYVIGGTIMVFTTWSGMRIVEPPIRSPTTERWKPWTTLSVGWRDRRMILLMVGVALISSFAIMYATWLWLFAANQLGVSKESIGKALAPSALIGVALAWPVGWMIDRIGGLKVTIAYIALLIIPFWFVMTAEGKTDIIWLAVMATLAGSLHTSAGMIILKIAPIKDVGSITSSAAFVKNLYVGLMIGVSGYVIEAFGDNYRLAFVLGMAMSLLGLILLFIYRDMMRRGGVQQIDQAVVA